MGKSYQEAEAELLAPRMALGYTQILSDSGWETTRRGNCYVTGKRAMTVKAQDERSAKLIGEWFTKGPFAPVGQYVGYSVAELERISDNSARYTIYGIEMSYSCDSSG